MDQKKWKQLIESIINDDEEAARAIFHDIVVDKSRSIYETMMMDEEDMDDMPGSEVDSLADEIEDEEDGVDDTEAEEPGDEEENLEDEFGAEKPMGDMGDEEGEEEGDLEDRLVDVEEKTDRIEELMAKFQQMMDKEGGSDLEDIGAEEEGEGMADMEAGAEEEGEGEEDEEAGADEFEAGEEDEEAGAAMKAMMEATAKLTKVPMPRHTATGGMSPVAGRNTDIPSGAHGVNFTAGGPAKGGSSRARPIGQSFANQPHANPRMTKVSAKASAGTRGGSQSPVAKRGK